MGEYNQTEVDSNWTENAPGTTVMGEYLWNGANSNWTEKVQASWIQSGSDEEEQNHWRSSGGVAGWMGAG